MILFPVVNRDILPAMPIPTVPTDIDTLSFLDALEAVQAGERITRLSWNDPATHVLMADGLLKIRKGDVLHALLVSDGDMAGTDWVVVEARGTKH